MAEPKKGLSGLTESHSVVTQIWHLLCKQDVPLHDSPHKSEQMGFFSGEMSQMNCILKKKKDFFYLSFIYKTDIVCMTKM